MRVSSYSFNRLCWPRQNTNNIKQLKQQFNFQQYKFQTPTISQFSFPKYYSHKNREEKRKDYDQNLIKFKEVEEEIFQPGIVTTKKELQELNRKIDKIEIEIEDVLNQIISIIEQLKQNHLSNSEKDELRDEKKRLQKKEEQLRDEKKQLQKKEEQLRELIIIKEREKLALQLPDIDQVQVQNLKPFDMNRLVHPLEVKLYPIDDSIHPPFCAEVGWLESTYKDIMTGLEKEDNHAERVPPMALIRFSRGGKTRALLELNNMIKERHPDIAVIFVSFNDFTALETWEMKNPVGALCRRIAFFALRERKLSNHCFNDLRKFDVKIDDIKAWIAETPCLLLIDELNVLELNKEGAPLISFFLKDNFLSIRNRYFVFSSHVVPRGLGLRDFMDSVSERGILIKQLPLIPSLKDAREKFQWPDLTVQQALYRGRVPALISYTRKPRIFDKRAAAISEVQSDWDDKKVINMLSTFLNGNPEKLPLPLLQLMSATSFSSENKILWIPFHMIHVLNSIADTTGVSEYLCNIVRTISDLFFAFDTGKTAGGTSWEVLFVIATLVRITTSNFHSLLLPKPDSITQTTTTTTGVSYNNNWGTPNLVFPNIKNMEQLIEGLREPPFPHIAVYYPSHSQFEEYDLIIVFYNTAGNRKVYGYQLKEGRAIPKNNNNARKHCDCSFVIRGYSSNHQKLKGDWIVASDGDIDDFLGITGATLAPKEWRKLDKDVV